MKLLDNIKWSYCQDCNKWWYELKGQLITTQSSPINYKNKTCRECVKMKNKSVNKLSKDDIKELLKQSILQGIDVKEISRNFNISEQAVRYHINKHKSGKYDDMNIERQNSEDKKIQSDVENYVRQVEEINDKLRTEIKAVNERNEELKNLLSSVENEAQHLRTENERLEDFLKARERSLPVQAAQLEAVFETRKDTDLDLAKKLIETSLALINKGA